MAPERASKIYLANHRGAQAFRVTLYGSLAATGKGHMTDRAIEDVLSQAGHVEIVWKPDVFLPFHPNGMMFETVDSRARTHDEWTVYSIGGGALSEGTANNRLHAVSVYDLTTISDIHAWCENYGRCYWEYVERCEGPQIWDFLSEVWDVMQQSILRGLNHEGALPGPLNLPRKAPTYYVKVRSFRRELQDRGLVYAYALAVSEENASGGTICTAPTCGACGAVPAVLYHAYHDEGFSKDKILHALATAGIFGNVVKTNASISGADVGCQGEVGVACAMASAAACQLYGGTPGQIEYAAEMALEHHLGMTCDPVCGLVQVPCIERNAYAAARAYDTQLYAILSDGHHMISFDHVVEVMKQTGHDLPSLYKETAAGGLARDYDISHKKK